MKVFCLLAVFAHPAAAQANPEISTLLKPRSVTRIADDHEIVVNSEWVKDTDFAFVDAGEIRAPFKFVRPMMLDLSLYPKMSSALKKFERDPTTGLIEVAGEAGGLHAHFWMKLDASQQNELVAEIVKGDMQRLKVHVYLWEIGSKTRVVAKGLWPNGRKAFSSAVALLFKPVSEVVLGVATNNFRSYIEEEYKKQRHSP